MTVNRIDIEYVTELKWGDIVRYNGLTLSVYHHLNDNSKWYLNNNGGWNADIFDGVVGTPEEIVGTHIGYENIIGDGIFPYINSLDNLLRFLKGFTRVNGVITVKKIDRGHLRFNMMEEWKS